MKPVSSTPRGRPRSIDSEQAVLAAAMTLLCEKGFASMSIEAVAASSGVAKTTIYRWWARRQDVAVEAFFRHTKEELAFPDTGSAAEDFRQQIQQLAAVLRGPSGRAMATLIEASRTDLMLRDALATRWIAPRRRWGQERMQLAIDSGQCVEGLDATAALEVLYSPIYARMLFGMGIPSAEAIDAHLRILFAGIFLPKK